MTGRPKRVSDSEILEAVTKTFGPATAPELADKVDIGKSGMNKRLNTLVNENLVHRKEVGANAVVYWLSDKAERKLSEE